MNGRTYLEFRCGGLDERLFPEPGYAARAVNLVHDRGGWRAAPGSDQVIDLADPIRTLCWFSQHTGSSYLVAESGSSGSEGTLSVVRWPNGIPTLETIEEGRRILNVPWTRTRYVQHNDWLYYFNSYNAPKRWNGRRTVPVGFSSAPPPPNLRGPTQGSTIIDQVWSDGTGLEAGPTDLLGADAAVFQRGLGERAEIGSEVPRWVYAYCQTWVNDLGQESPPSAIAVIRDGNRSLTGTEALGALLGCLVEGAAPPPHVMAIRTYRSVNLYGETLTGITPPVYLLDECEPTMAPCYFDLTPDSGLGPQLDTDQVGLVPSQARLASVFGGAMFLVAQNRVFFSPPGRPEQFPAVNELRVGGPAGGEFRFLHATRGALVVGRARGIYLVLPTDSGSFRSETLTEDVGGLCPDVVEVPGVGVVFLSERGPVRLYGGEEVGAPNRYEILSTGIEKTWERVNVDALAGATVALHRREREVWFHVPIAGETKPTLGIVFHYPSGFWSTREGWEITCLCETRDERADLFYGAADGLWHVSRGYTQSLEVAWRSAPVAIAVDQVRVFATIPLLLANGKHELEVSVYLDRLPVAFETERIYSLDPKLGTPTYEGPPLWGNAPWSDSAIWADLRPVRFRVDLSTGSAGEFQVEFNGASLTLSSYHLEVLAPGPARPPPMGGNIR